MILAYTLQSLNSLQQHSIVSELIDRFGTFALQMTTHIIKFLFPQSFSQELSIKGTIDTPHPLHITTSI